MGIQINGQLDEIRALDGHGVSYLDVVGNINSTGIATFSKTFVGTAVTDSKPVLEITSTVQDPIYGENFSLRLDDYDQRNGVKIDVGYAQTEFDSKVILQDWENNHLVLQKSGGDYQPGCYFRGRYPDKNYKSGLGTMYYNGYSDIWLSSTAMAGFSSSKISNQTQGFNPSKDYLRHGVINDNTVITGTDTHAYKAEKFGAGGVGRVGFCYITYSGDVVIRLHQESGDYAISHDNVDVYADPGAAVQAILSATTNHGEAIEYLPEEYANIGVSTDYQAGDLSQRKDANKNNIGKVVKVVGEIEAAGNDSSFFCLTEEGYVWATSEHNTYGFLNKGNTTNVREPVIVWDIFGVDSKDEYVGNSATAAPTPRRVANITSSHDNASDTGTGTVFYIKVVQEDSSDRYHEMWHTGGYNASGSLADGTTTSRNFGRACLFDVSDDGTDNNTYTGTYLQSNDGINAGTAGNDIRITFTEDPTLYLGEYIRIDFTSGGGNDDFYKVTENNGSGTYSVVRWNAQGAGANTSENTSGNFSVLGRSRLLKKLGRFIHGQWSGGGSNGFCFIQDSTHRIWGVGEAGSGIMGTGAQTDQKFFQEISTGNSLPLKEVVKMIPGGTDSSHQNNFILFSDYTLWHAGRNNSGYGYDNTSIKTTYTQIAGPGTNTSTIPNPPLGKVYNFWYRNRNSASNTYGDTLYVQDYTDADGWCLWCVGENGNRQLANNSTSDSRVWITPTLFPQNYGTNSSPNRTKTGWIVEQMWIGQAAAGSGGSCFHALFRNLTTNEYRMYAWGNNDGYLGDGVTATPNPGPIRLTFDIPAYKIKDIVVWARDTNFYGIGMIITQDGDLYGIGGTRYYDGTNYVTAGAFWTPSNGGNNSTKFTRMWTKVDPLGPY